MIEIEQRLERSAEQIRTATTRVAVPARLSHPGERSPRRNGLLAVAAVAAVTVGGLVVVVQTTDTESPPATQPPATPPVDREEGSGSWQQMAAAPIRSRIGAASVSTGNEWVVWGERDDEHLADGTAYSFADDTWRTLPRSPLSPRTDAIAVWTGSEVVILGGIAGERISGDGAAWNPETGEWRELPTLPFAAVAGQTAVAWTGKEIVLVGVVPGSNVRLASDTFAIDPVTGDASALDPYPEPPPTEEDGTPVPRARAAVYTGSEVLVVSIADGFPVVIDRLDPVEGTWGSPVTTSTPGLDVGPDGVVWTGTELVIVNHLSEGTVFDPATGEQTPIPTSNSVIRFPAVVVGSTVFVGDRWLDASREWHDAAAAPEPFREFPVTVAHGGRGYVWGGDACGPAANCPRLVDPGPGVIWTPGS